MKEKLINLTKTIFSYVTAALMAIFVLILAAYIVALIIGGDTGIAIDHFFSASVLPIMYIVSVVTSFVGILNMYLRGKKAFTMESGTGKNNKKDENKTKETEK